jgi:hypothetical protein
LPLSRLKGSKNGVLLPTYLINGRPKTGASHVALTSASYAPLDMIIEGNFENMLTERRVCVTGDAEFRVAFLCHSFVICCQRSESIERKPETPRAMGSLKPLQILDKSQAARFSRLFEGRNHLPKKPRNAGSTSFILLYTLAIGSVPRSMQCREILAWSGTLAVGARLETLFFLN